MSYSRNPIDEIREAFKEPLAKYSQNRFEKNGNKPFYGFYRTKEIASMDLMTGEPETIRFAKGLGYMKSDKLNAVTNFQDFLNGNTYALSDKDILVLRNKTLGDTIRKTAQKLAVDLNLPEIATIRGLINYVANNSELKSSPRY